MPGQVDKSDLVQRGDMRSYVLCYFTISCKVMQGTGCACVCVPAHVAAAVTSTLFFLLYDVRGFYFQFCASQYSALQCKGLHALPIVYAVATFARGNEMR